MVRRAGVALVLGVGLAAWAGFAHGAVLVSAPPPAPSSLVLAPSDFRSGAAVLTQSGGTVKGEQLYLRVFKPGARFGSKPLATAVSIALIEPDASTAQFGFSEFQISAKTKSGRQALAKDWAVDFVRGLKLGAKGGKVPKTEKVTVGVPTNVGSTAMLLPISVKTSVGTMRMAMIFTAVDRVVSVELLLGEADAAVAPSDTRAALSAIQARLTAAFTVANTSPPTIAGTAAVGQTLTADAGAWNGAPSSFTYSWSRCDATGATCQAIPNAVSQTYQATTADAGSTLVVAATGTNSVGSATASSVPTAVVTS